MLGSELQNGESYAEAISRDFGWAAEKVFVNQYLVVSRNDPATGFPDWCSKNLTVEGEDDRGWVLLHDPDRDAYPVVDASDQIVGWVYGVAIDPDDQVVSSALRLPFQADQAGAINAFEELLMDLRGRYVALLRLSGQVVLYTDPGGDMGAVYDPLSRRVAMSLAVVLNPTIQGLDGARVTFPRLKSGASPLRASRTADNTVRRLLPNHRLDLSDFSTRRFWPKTAPQLNDDPVEKISSDIARRLTSNIAALTTHMSTSIPISGGRDSKILLALAAKASVLPAVSFTHRTNWISGYDAIAGQAIAAHLDVFYRFLDAVSLTNNQEWMAAAKQERQLAFARSGFGASIVRPVTSLSQLMVPDTPLILRGNIMEMLGGRFHKSEGVHDIGTMYKLIWGREPETEEERRLWLGDYCAWLADVPSGMPEKSALDLAFIELLYSHDMAVSLQSAPIGFYINPFCDRRLIEAALRTPSSVRRSTALYEGVLAQGAEVPRLAKPKAMGARDKEGTALGSFLATRRLDTTLYEQKGPPDIAKTIGDRS